MLELESTLQVAACDKPLLDQAMRLAAKLNLAPAKIVSDISRCAHPLLLYVTYQGLQLQTTGKKAPGPVWVDFLSGSVAHRRKFGGGAGQMIAKAVGVKSGVRPTVLDATAGLGKDSFVLATLGCSLSMIERSPIIHALLEDGLSRAMADAEVVEVCSRMALYQGDAIELMGTMDRPQVVYLDPMFPHSEKSALVKKEMRVFRDVVGDDQDSALLLEAALDTATARVVVKRARKAPLIQGRAPSYQLEGKSSRYDIYALARLQS
ncbi:class I SAM-dependent methyltransferase [Neptunomonas qingdaonensis]|uniref:Ribosomal RNA small subunit methyltransferase J n=1 Tax=Neptunomonas qingdaonensis TaxID=1045558 RepID=A0A1I2S9E9_9GAMM|nr:class I SAM-dependent methyltransferase [Neptunomonas qingdaonensis]SFG49535.1 16S rRNA (guanine1516-N2)-methyltransferase [Neptunomonas qingdaonensis]